ncbi:MAG: aminoacyl-tRNA hydrolase [Ruminococcaceae bacterium]|nr:aminoacyl-tRNA hydrolase [Oscillospiraceae bacterium]
MSDIFALFDLIEKKKPSSNLPLTHLVVGLGNPDAKYANTRHNAGFMFLDLVSGKTGVKIDRAKYNALTAEAVIAGKRVLLMKPLTYMNLSGNAVRPAADFYKIPAENIIIIYDDVSLDVGKLRIRLKGSDGGHRGIRSITEQLSTQNFPRIKLGVGQKPNQEYDLKDWVLKDIPKDQRESFKAAAENAYEALELMLNGENEKAMNKYN